MQRQSKGIIDAFWLKMIMAVLMVLDHLYYRVFPDTLYWGHVAARVVAPMFCYLVTEGMLYTRDRVRYILRIFSFGLVMMAGNGILYLLYGRWIENSILISLAIGAGGIACIDQCAKAQGIPSKIGWIAAVVGLFVASLFFEGGNMIPLMAIIFYYLRHRPIAMWVTYFVVFCGQYVIVYFITGTLYSQFWMILAIIPILCYNGQRGISGRFSKYFFYVFYPLHIWVIFFIEKALGVG